MIDTLASTPTDPDIVRRSLARSPHKALRQSGGMPRETITLRYVQGEGQRTLVIRDEDWTTLVRLLEARGRYRTGFVFESIT